MNFLFLDAYSKCFTYQPQTSVPTKMVVVTIEACRVALAKQGQHSQRAARAPPLSPHIKSEKQRWFLARK